MRNIVTTLLDVDGGDVAVLLRFLVVAVNSFLLTATNSVTPEADTVAQVGKAWDENQTKDVTLLPADRYTPLTSAMA